MSGGPARREPWRAGAGGILIEVRLTPRAGADRVDAIGEGVGGPLLRVRVRAAPDRGAANAGLERLIADWLDVPARTVRLVAGGKARQKTIAVAGAADALLARVAARARALASEP